MKIEWLFAETGLDPTADAAAGVWIFDTGASVNTQLPLTSSI